MDRPAEPLAKPDQASIVQGSSLKKDKDDVPVPPSLPQNNDLPPSQPPLPAADISPLIQPEEPPPIPPHPLDFSPFFTLLTSSSQTHHPTTRYIFADDPADSNPITAAALDTLDPTDPSESSSPDVTPDADGDRKSHTTRTGTAGIHSSRRREERYLVVDLDETGTKVISAKSMSPTWAVTSAEIVPASALDVGAALTKGSGGTRDGTGERERDAGKGMMLKIEGTECLIDTHLESKEDAGAGERSLEQLAEEYERRSAELKKVVEFSLTGDEKTPCSDQVVDQ